MTDTFEISRYVYYPWSSRNPGPAAGPPMACALLYGTTRYLGAIWFVDSTEPLPLATKSSTGIYTLYYRMRDLPTIVDLLRNEKPVFLHFADGINARLSTGEEPVGEGEVPVAAAAVEARVREPVPA